MTPLLVFAGYVFSVIFLVSLTFNYFTPQTEDESGGLLIVCVFWPIAAPILFTIWLGKCFSDKIKNRSIRRNNNDK